MKILKITGIVLILLACYLIFWPVAIKPEAWEPPKAPTLEGVYAPNSALDAMKKVPTQLGEGPEDVAQDSSGNLYAGLLNGIIIKCNSDGSHPVSFADTKGRPLGLHFDANQNLIVADAKKGLLSVSPEGIITTLVDSYDGKPFIFADDLDIDGNGIIYFSDASMRFGVDHYMDDFMEHGKTGRLFSYDPFTQKTELLLDGLKFANGIAVSPDENYVLVNETSAYRIIRYWLTGSKKGTSEVFIENLPGFPDGISCNDKDLFWVAIANPRNPVLDKLLPSPFLRKVVDRLPEAMRPGPVRYGMVLGIDTNGKVKYNLQSPTGGFAPVTSVEQVGKRLLLGSLSEPEFGVIELPESYPQTP